MTDFSEEVAGFPTAALVMRWRSDTQAWSQMAEIVRLHLQSASLHPFSFFFFFTISSHRSRHPLRHPRASLGGYFPSRMCWVTTGSTSSQQSGLKFNESPDAYFIVQCPLSILLYPSGCMSLPSPPLAAGDLPLCIRSVPAWHLIALITWQWVTCK